MTAYSTTTLAWGMPVKADILGAHLAAYLECKPVVQTLRLCHRFGKGPQAFITNLPLEIVDLVEGMLFDESRKTHRMEWGKEFRCYEDMCAPVEHYTEDRLEELRQDMALSGCDCGGECLDGHEERFDEMLGDLEERYEVHFSRFHLWEERVERSGDFKMFNDLLKADFGLEASLSNHFLDDFVKTTICHLILPTRSIVEDKFVGEQGFDTTSSFIISPAHCTPRSRKEKARFKRTLKTLHLASYVHPTQMKTTLPRHSHMGVPEKIDGCEKIVAGCTYSKALERTKWPKLILVNHFVAH
ncbi:MAG: hypothetical protein M1830_006042 [Pleopsidium flavum]|nr:MAG: hypothetical protein M1830_006042 [Pleopsidium flavum]